jgi:hypothetical protein
MVRSDKLRPAQLQKSKRKRNYRSVSPAPFCSPTNGRTPKKYKVSDQSEPYQLIGEHPAMKRAFLPIEALPSWARLNGIEFYDVAFQRIGSGEAGAPDRGSAVFGTTDRSQAIRADDEGPTKPREETLIKVPPDMVLSLGLVEDYAKSDKWLREVLDAMEGYGKVGCL